MTQPNPYYLPDERAREIFTNKIVRERFAGVVSHRDDGQQPVAVIVMGQRAVASSSSVSRAGRGAASASNEASTVRGRTAVVPPRLVDRSR
jgi:hypothetical protein